METNHGHSYRIRNHAQGLHRKILNRARLNELDELTDLPTARVPLSTHSAASALLRGPRERSLYSFRDVARENRVEHLDALRSFARKQTS